MANITAADTLTDNSPSDYMTRNNKLKVCSLHLQKKHVVFILLNADM